VNQTQASTNKASQSSGSSTLFTMLGAAIAEYP
jgi:hypothetical protein